MVGAGDGGAYSTAGDLEKLWNGLFSGKILDEALLQRLIRPRTERASGDLDSAMGFWRRARSATVSLEGADRGVSARTAYDPDAGLVSTVLSNTQRGAWPLVSAIEARWDRLTSE